MSDRGVENIKDSEGYVRHETSTKTAVCLSVSSDLSFAVGVTLLNFIRLHGSSDFHFRVFSDKKLERMSKIFRHIGADVSTERYRPPVRWTTLWGSRAIAYFSPLVLAKFEGFRILSKFHTVVWLDYDILITKSIKELWMKPDFDLAYLGSGQPMGNGFISPPEGLDKAKEGLSAGIMVFRDTFPIFGSATDSLYSLFSQHATNLYFPEQAMFDLYLDSHSGYRKWALGETYCELPGAESGSSAILHAYGPNKFWSGSPHQHWNQYYNEWMQMGGWSWSPTASKIAKFKRGLRHLIAITILRFRSIKICGHN